MAIWEVSNDEETIEGLDADGRPDPADASALGFGPAPLGRRAASVVIDIVGYLLLQIPYWIFTLPLLLMLIMGQISLYGLVNHPDFILAIVMVSISFALSTAYCIVQMVMHGRRGVTIGKRIMGYRGINVKTLERPGFWRMVLRFLVLYFSSLVVIGPIIFLLSPLFDPEKRGRGWHDMVGHVWYVDIRKGLNPYDDKRMRIARKMITAAPVVKQKQMPSLATPSRQGEPEEYRPGGRASAGVLGVARPHGSGSRPEVGLAGTEEVPPPSEESPGAAGLPVLGASRTRAQEHELPGEEARTGHPETAAPGMQSPPSPAPQPPAPQPSGPQAPAGPGQQGGHPANTAVPGMPQATGQVPPAPQSGGVVTGTPWSAPRPDAAPAPQQYPQNPQSQQPPQSQAPPPQPPAPAPPPPAQPHTPQPAQQPAVQQPAQQPAQGQQPQARAFALRLDTGEQLSVTEPILIGRNPAAQSARAVPITDESRSISKTHMLLSPTETGIEVTDQRSTNGSAV